jgi:hypothetical protein
MMPSSFKGAQKKITHRPVPITPALAAALKRATSDRPGDTPLLLKRDGIRQRLVSVPYIISKQGRIVLSQRYRRSRRQAGGAAHCQGFAKLAGQPD